jgi:hypothetical protein
MTIPPENLAMVGSDWPGADWNRETSTRLVGPRRGEELCAHAPGRLAAADARDIEALFRAAL